MIIDNKPPHETNPYTPQSSPTKHLKDIDIDEITAKINTRLRKELNFSTPMEEFFNYLL